MPEETQGQAEMQPGAEGGGVASEATPEVTEAPQAVDYAALEKQVAGLGEGYSLSNITAKYEDARRGMNDAQRLKSETDRRYEYIEPLVERLQADPKFAAHLQQSTQEYYNTGGTASMDGEVPPAVATGLDPLYNRLAQLEVEQAGSKIDLEIDRLKAKGMPITEDVYSKIMGRIQSSKDIGQIEAYAWAECGPKMVSDASSQATKDVTDKIKDNNSAYVNVPSGQSPTPALDVTQASKSDFDDMVLKEIEERING